jgi:hypothetical protein
VLAAVLAIAFGGARTPTVNAQSNGAAAGAIRTYSTISSIGIEWDVIGDADHDATASVAYRVVGSTEWRSALPLVRVDYNGSNMLAGSILFLSPNATYEIRLTFSDPDGGSAGQTVTVATRPVPAMPVGGRSFHVVPGTGGGNGSSANPFRGVAAAEAVAQPGDIFVLHAGNYGGRVTFTRPGTSSASIVWMGAGDGEALFAGIDVSASYVWLEGLTLRDQAYALMSKNAPTGVVVSRCAFFNNHYSIYLQRGGSNWYIADNTIVGDTPYSTESLDGEGIELNGYAVDSYGHVVAHNSITNVADGISNGTYNIDVVGNDIFDTSDDGFEGDPGGPNIRVWGNRIHNAAHNGISYQPQNNSPWYIIRNQLVGFMEAPFKFRTTDRSVIAHNTIGMWSKMICCNDSHLLRSIVKNNLWVSVAPFRYGGVTYSSLSARATASGLETTGRRINRTTCFTTFNVPGPAPGPVPAQYMTLTAACNGVDAGVILPNIDDEFVGNAPDLGAYELGLPLPTYGPRPRIPMSPPPPPTNVRIVG